MSTYDVRVWGIREHKGRDRKTGKDRSTYRVRWEVAGQEFGKSYQTKALAESSGPGLSPPNARASPSMRPPAYPNRWPAN